MYLIKLFVVSYCFDSFTIYYNGKRCIAKHSELRAWKALASELHLLSGAFPSTLESSEALLLTTDPGFGRTHCLPLSVGQWYPSKL